MSFAEFCSGMSRIGPRPGLVVLRQCESTQILARRVVADYGRDGMKPPLSTLVAWRQLRGHGRHDRPWRSPAGGGAYVSMVRPLGSPSSLQQLPLVVAVALCEAANAHLGDRCRLKWPNDLLVDGRKLGGILIESFSRQRVVVIGFGLNYDFRDEGFAPEGGFEEATSLCRETSMEASLPEVVDALIRAVDEAMGEGGVGFLQRYRELSVHRPGDTIRCRMEGEILQGKFLGFDDYGLLRLTAKHGECRVSTGEVLARQNGERGAEGV